MAEVKVRGLDNLRKELRAIPFRLQQNALRIAVQEAAKFVAQELKAATPAWAGYVSPKRRATRPPGALRASVAARRRKARRFQVRSSVDMLFYGRLLEKGWKLTGHAPDKKHIRDIGPRPFILPRFLAVKDRAIEIIADAVRREIVNQPKKAQARARTQLAKAVTSVIGSGGE